MSTKCPFSMHDTVEKNRLNQIHRFYRFVFIFTFSRLIIVFIYAYSKKGT